MTDRAASIRSDEAPTAWPASPSSPARHDTKLRSLPITNRLFNKLPSFLSRSGGSAGPESNFWRFPTEILNGLAPATTNKLTEMPNTIVEQGEKARPDQTLIERVQQERMKQESQAAMSNSEELASGKSYLLKGQSSEARTSNEEAIATRNGKARSMSMPANGEAPALSVQQAALATAIHHHKYGAALTKKAKVTFQALVDHMPHGAQKIFHRRQHRRARSYSHNDSFAAKGRGELPAPGQAHRRASFNSLPATPTSFFKRFLTRVVDFFREGLFLIHLALLLVAQMGLFGRWILMTVRLIIFAIFLMQAWVKIGYTVLFCHRIERSIQYGPYNRNFLDIYLPTKIRGSILKPIENNQYQRECTEINDPEHDHSQDGPKKHPVFVYVTGGAWIIGYKAWGGLIGLIMRAQGYVVVSADYRNFPQGNIEDMVIDIEQALRWVYDNIEDFGGDKTQIYLGGQSAGGQITSLLLLRNSKREAEGFFDEELNEEQHGVNEAEKLEKVHAICAEATAIADHAQKEMLNSADADSDGTGNGNDCANDSDVDSADAPPIPKLDVTTGDTDTDGSDSDTSTRTRTPSPTSLIAVSSALRTGFPVTRIKGYLGLSGVYAMTPEIVNHLHASGLPGGVVIAIMGGYEHIRAVDPTRLIKQLEYFSPKVAAKFPPVFLIHGSGDKSMPLSVAHDYASALAHAGIPVTFRCYIGATHTDPIIEHPLRGCHHLTYDLRDFIVRCQNGEALLGRDRRACKMVKDEKGTMRCEPIKIHRLPSLGFNVNGEKMVNPVSVNCASFFNPF